VDCVPRAGSQARRQFRRTRRERNPGS
jgi:hypothetical protein